jgi:hypothetical protein
LNDAQNVLANIRMLSPGHYGTRCKRKTERIAMIFKIERDFSSCHKHPDGPNGNCKWEYAGSTQRGAFRNSGMSDGNFVGDAFGVKERQQISSHRDGCC